MPSVFGWVRLGYLVVETEKFADWRRFGRDAIGMHLDEVSSEAILFRLDEHQCRFLLQRGPAEDVVVLGWELDDHATFDEIRSRVSGHGVPVTDGSADEAAVRGPSGWPGFPGPTD